MNLKNRKHPVFLMRGVERHQLSSTKEDFLNYIRNGQLRRGSVSEWESIPEEQRDNLIRQAQNTPPLTDSSASSDCKNLLRSYLSQGLLPGFYPNDLKILTAEDAGFFLQCAEDNRGHGDKPLGEYYRRTNIDTTPADPEQLSRIIELVRAGYLNPFSSKTLLKLCHLSAHHLIWRGEMNRREGVHVSHKR